MIQPITSGIYQYNQRNTNISPTPDKKNYNVFNQNNVDTFVKKGEDALPYLSQILLYSNNEEQIAETLYIKGG